jgi:hypothetical protein
MSRKAHCHRVEELDQTETAALKDGGLNENSPLGGNDDRFSLAVLFAKSTVAESETTTKES